jgi:hypothetical protein
MPAANAWRLCFWHHALRMWSAAQAVVLSRQLCRARLRSPGSLRFRGVPHPPAQLQKRPLALVFDAARRRSKRQRDNTFTDPCLRSPWHDRMASFPQTKS